MVDEKHLVQPLVVVPQEEGLTLESLIRAVAIGSLQVREKASEESLSRWREWQATAYRKSVRRAKEKDLRKLQQVAQDEGLVTTLVELAPGLCLAFEPMTYEAMPKPLRRCQVSGLEVPGQLPLVEGDPLPGTLVVDDSLGLSSGKLAAQVAHAAWLAQEQLPSFSPRVMLLRRASHSTFTKVCEASGLWITDSGLTELSGPTPTVAVVV